MRTFDIIRTANANLRRSKLRTFLTMSAVFIGTLTLMLTTGVGEGLKTYVEEQIGSLGAKDVLLVTPHTEGANPLGGEVVEYDPDQVSSSAMGFSQALLTAEDLAVIAAEDGIKEVTPIYPTSADYVTTGDKKFMAVLGQTVDGLVQPIRTGRMVEQYASDYEVTIPGEFVEPLGFSSDDDAVGSSLTYAFTGVTGEKFEMTATIVGVQAKALVNANAHTGNLKLIKDIYARNTAALGARAEQYPNAFARFDDSMSAAELEALKKNLSDKKYDASTLEDQLGIIKQIIDGVITFLNVFAGITLAAATFGIINTLYMAVQERTREIGLMKALGMGRRKIFALFSFEAILIGFWGAMIAWGVALLAGKIGSDIASRTIFKDFEGLRLFSFPLGAMIPVVLTIMVIAFLAATLPARRASKLDPIDALRYE